MSRFPRTYRTAVAKQMALRDRIVVRGDVRKVRRIAGADISYDQGSDLFFATVVVLGWPGLELIEVAHVQGKSPMPYIPGLLSFREGPTLVRAFRKLAVKPDLAVFDGHGLAHPRRFGVACHLGLLLDVPSIGCGKTRLVGEHEEPGPAVGDYAPLRFEGRVVGRVVRTREGTKPVFVSAGHRIGLPASMRWILRCGAGYRLPETTRWAHRLANRERARRGAQARRS
ncbi:MAG: deoxyribonuclease V [Planctomycetota bacterium]